MASPNKSERDVGSQGASGSKSALEMLGSVVGAGSGQLTERFRQGSEVVLQALSLTVLRGLCVAFIILALLLSSTLIVGWVGNVDALTRLFYGQIVGFPTAFWLTVLGLSAIPAVLDLKGNPALLGLRIVGRIGLLIVFAASASLWIEHLAGQDWNPSFVIYQSQATELKLMGPVPVDVSFCLVWTSLTALMLDFFGSKMPRLPQIMSLIMALPSFFLVLGCLYGLNEAAGLFCAVTGCVNFKYLTYIVFFCLQGAIFLARPTMGVASFLAVDSLGGRMARLSALGTLIMIPFGWLLIQGARSEMINNAAAIGLGVVGFIVVFGMLIAYGARKIDKIDLEKAITEQSLSELSDLQDSKFDYKMVCLECGEEYPDEYEACPQDGSAMARVLDKLAPGSVFGKKYVIERALGSGGMSTVYKAQHQFLDKVVAIKLLNHQLSSDAKAVQRFQVEAKAAYELDHPNLLGVYDFGMSNDGQAYIVMDYLEGESLAEIIQREKTISLVRALPIFLDVAKGLNYAHEKAVLHRDIKPSNVMLVGGQNGRPLAKIVDFGLAKIYDDNAMKLTQTGEIFGSPLYMSPEQCRGLPLDNRSDLYSLGVLMYEVLSGKPPIMGNGVYETFQKKLTDTPPPFEPELKVPEWMAQLIFCMMRVEPKERPATARAVVTALSQFVK